MRLNNHGFRTKYRNGYCVLKSAIGICITNAHVPSDVRVRRSPEFALAANDSKAGCDRRILTAR